MARLRTVFLLEDLCFGGTQRQNLELALRLDRDRFEPVLLTLTGETDFDARVRAGGLRLVHMGGSRRVDPFFFLRLPGFLKALSPDILVPCTALPNIWGRLWGRLSRKENGCRPVIVGTVRGGGGPKRQHERLLWRLADHLVCNSEDLAVRLHLLGVPARRVSFIPNGVDTARLAPRPPLPSERSPLILCLARYCEDKDHATLLRAFARVHAACPSARLRLAGDGPWAAKVRALAAASPAASAIEVLPGTQDVRPHLAQAAVLALSSVREGTPNVLLEAMACGLPVCATAVGGIPRLVEEGKTGLLSPAGDDGALAAGLLRLIGDGALADAMGRAGRELAVQRYSFAAMVRAHEVLFSRLAEGLRGRSA